MPVGPQSPHDHADGSQPCQPIGWQPASAVVKCAGRKKPAKWWMPLSNVNPDPFTTRPEIEGTFGVVSSTHWIVNAVGLATLEKDSNAFDAGVAPGFSRQAVEPHLTGPGG